MKYKILSGASLAAFAVVSSLAFGAHATSQTVTYNDCATEDNDYGCSVSGGILTTTGDLVLTVQAADKITNIINDGTLEITGEGTITSTSGHTVVNNGTLTVAKGANITFDAQQNGTAALWNNKTATLNGGTFKRSLEDGVDKNNSGTNSFYTIVNHGEMVVNAGVSVENNGHFSSMFENGYYNYGSGNQSNGYVEGTNLAAPTLTINGGTFSGGLNTIKNDDGATITIADGTFKNSTQSVFMNNHVATVSGGTFDGTDSEYVLINRGYTGGHNTGSLVITGGTFKKGDSTEFVLFDKKTDESYISIKGGTYEEFAEADLDSAYIADGYEFNAETKTVEYATPDLVDEVTKIDLKTPVEDVTVGALATPGLADSIAAFLKDKEAPAAAYAYAVEVEDGDLENDIPAVAEEKLANLTPISVVDITIKVYVPAHLISASATAPTEYEVPELAQPITLAAMLPEDLQSPAEGYRRNFYVVRVHDGVATILPATQSEDGTYVTFASNLFSTFIVAYADEEVVEEPDAGFSTYETSSLSDGYVAVIGAAIAMGFGLAATALRIAKRKAQGEE